MVISTYLSTCLVIQSCLTLCETMDYIAFQGPLSMEILQQENWRGLPLSPPGYLLNPGIKPRSPYCRLILYHLSYLDDYYLNVNELNALIKSKHIGLKKKKQVTVICYLQETHFRVKDTQTESEGMEKDISKNTNINNKNMGKAILLSDKMDFKAKLWWWRKALCLHVQSYPICQAPLSMRFPRQEY